MKNVRIYHIALLCSMVFTGSLLADSQTRFPATSVVAVSNSFSEIKKILKDPNAAVILQDNETSPARFNSKTIMNDTLVADLLTFLRDAARNGLSKENHAFIMDFLVYKLGLSYEGCLKLKGVKGDKPVLHEAADQYGNVILALKDGFTHGLAVDFKYIEPALKNALIFENLSDIVFEKFNEAYSCNFFAIKDVKKTEETKIAYDKARAAIATGSGLKEDVKVEDITAYIDAMTAFADQGGFLSDQEEAFFKECIAHLKSAQVLQSSASDLHIKSLIDSLGKVSPEALTTRSKSGNSSLSAEVQELVSVAKTTLALKKAFNDNKYINQADKDVMKGKESAQEIIETVSEFIRKVAGSLVGGYGLNAVIDGKPATTKADVKLPDAKDKDALKAVQAELAALKKEYDAVKDGLAKCTLFEESLKTPAEQVNALVASVERLAKALPDTKITKIKSISGNVCDKAVVELAKKEPSK